MIFNFIGSFGLPTHAIVSLMISQAPLIFNYKQQENIRPYSLSQAEAHHYQTGGLSRPPDEINQQDHTLLEERM